MNGFVPTYCSKCGMRMVPAPNLCACQPAPAERVQQIIAERDLLRAVNAGLLAALQRCLTHFERIRDQQADPHDSPMMAQARAAIARATGVKS